MLTLAEELNPECEFLHGIGSRLTREGLSASA